MIPVTGMSSLLALKVTDATESSQRQTIRSSAQHARAIDTFRERIAEVRNVDDLVEDYELYSFVMKAYDLEDQIFGKAMISKMLKSDISDRGALINRLTDPRFKEMYLDLGFGEGGEGNINTLLKSWQDEMVDRYVDRQFVNAAAEQNETLGAALEFRRKAAEIDTPFDILKDKTLGRFMRTALGLPDQMVGIDIDKQAAIIEEKYDLEKLKDPKEVEALITRYLAISDALNGPATGPQNGVVQLISGAVQAGSGGFVPVVIDITGISAIRGGY